MVFSMGTLYLFYNFLQHCSWVWGKQGRHYESHCSDGERSSEVAWLLPVPRCVVEWKLSEVWCPQLCSPLHHAPNLNQCWDTFFYLNLTKTRQHMSWLSPPDENAFLWLETMGYSEYPDTDYQVLLKHLHARLASDFYFTSCNVSLKQWSLSHYISENKNIKPS